VRKDHKEGRENEKSQKKVKTHSFFKNHSWGPRGDPLNKRRKKALPGGEGFLIFFKRGGGLLAVAARKSRYEKVQTRGLREKWHSCG